MKNRYQFISKKLVPDWYRTYIPYARMLKLEIQKRMYMIGYEANYMSFKSEEDYVVDRFFIQL